VKSVLKKLRPYLMVLAVVLIAYVLYQSDIPGIAAAVKATPITQLLLVIGLQLITQLLLNFQWYRLSRIMGWKTSFAKLLVVNAYGVVADAITPGEKVGGEVARVVQLKSSFGYTTAQSTILVTIQKALSLCALVVLNLMVVLTMADRVSFLQPMPVRIAVLVILIIIAAFLFLLLFHTNRLAARMCRIRAKKKWLKVFINWTDSFAQHTQIIRQKRGEWVLQFVLSVLIWSVFPLKLILLVSSYHAQIPALALFGTTFVAYFAGMIPLLPGGLGTFEAAMSSILIVYGLSFQQALAATVVFRFVTFWLVVLVSVAMIVVHRIALRKRARQPEMKHDS
jgi:uncharacterized protein (TIRG00374 family)